MKPENVTCPDCEGPMVSRTSKHGVFWGCKDYPRCKGTRDSQGRTRQERFIEQGDHGIANGGVSWSRRYD